MIRGFVTGGFRPFHKGHEALIEYAKLNCDHLDIFVADPPESVIPFKYRLNWVSSRYLHDPQVEVHGGSVMEPYFESSDDKSRWWGKMVRERFGTIDRVFTSENYGTIFSKSVGAENWVFNQARDIIPVSGTAIREKPLTNWKYINNFAKDYFVKKICIIGTESTGKTVLAKTLAAHYNTVVALEKGRDIFEHGKSGIEAIKEIGFAHSENIIRQLRKANKLLFVDTDLNITKSYSSFLFKEVPKFAPWMEEANKMDLYIYLDHKNVPYIDDGTRLIEDERNKLAENHKKWLRSSKDVINIEFDTEAKYPYYKRLEQVIQEIDKFIAKY